MKGIILNYKTIKQIYQFSPESVTLEEINKLPKLYDKRVKINKKEFVQIINVLGKMIKNNLFERIDDSQIFIINLESSITEFDVLTVLKMNNINVILNIEVKSYEENNKEIVKSKLEEQMSKRIEEHLQQMFINDAYIVLGYLNEEFYKGMFKEKDKELNILDEERTFELLNKLGNNQQAFSKIQVSENLSNIQSVYSKLKKGDFKIYAENRRTLEKINQSMEEKKVIMCLAKPGYGKTVLALSLFFNNENAKLLILNQKFYNTFYMSEYYSSNKAFFGTDTYISKISQDTISIIDEAQRLSKRDLKRIIEKSKKVILFGDTGQAFMETDEFITEKMYEEAIEEIVQEDFEKIKLKVPVRYTEEVDRALKYLYDRRCEKRDLRKIQNFSINLYNTEIDFIRKYNQIEDSKKIFKMYTSDKLNQDIHVKFDDHEYTFRMVGRDYWDFAISGNIPCFGHTLHAISFDIENVFLCLDNLIYSEKKKMPIPYGLDDEDDIAFQKYINELDILLTRARKTLNIFVSDFRTYLWFNEKIYDINNVSEILD